MQVRSKLLLVFGALTALLCMNMYIMLYYMLTDTTVHYDMEAERRYNTQQMKRNETLNRKWREIINVKHNMEYTDVATNHHATHTNHTPIHTSHTPRHPEHTTHTYHTHPHTNFRHTNHTRSHTNPTVIHTNPIPTHTNNSYNTPPNTNHTPPNTNHTPTHINYTTTTPNNATITQYLINTEKCRIPLHHINDPSIAPYFTIPKDRNLNCPQHLSITYESNDYIFINNSVVKSAYNNTLTTCIADDVIRVNTSDDKNVYDNSRELNETGIKLDAEFTRIRCFKKGPKRDLVIYTNVYAKHVHKENADRRYMTHFPQHVTKVDDVFNVLMIGIDTVSRMNFERHINGTRDFLMNELHAIEYLGYNKEGENTFPNIVELLSGQYINELPWDLNMEDKTFDRFKFIFKEYAEAGYATLLAEDDPRVTTFNLLKPGFMNPPTDYYFRPMALVMERFSPRPWRGHDCFFERSEQDIVLDYIEKFARANVLYKRPFFGWSLLNRLTHTTKNKAAFVDSIHLPFLRRIRDANLLQNTVLIYYSDHGWRWGEYRATYIGGLAARLPALYITVPERFRIKYPQLYKNLQDNAKTLTSPFDVYETLKDILYFKVKQSAQTQTESTDRSTRKIPTNTAEETPLKTKGHGLSLLRRIPARSCREASISDHWCACTDQQHIETNSPVILQAAKYFVSHLNNIVSSFVNVCEQLRLSKVLRAERVVIDTSVKYENNNKFTEPFSSTNEKLHDIAYKIMLMTEPGNALFEATIKKGDEGTFRTTEEINRLSFYGETSWCVNDTIRQRICYCKQQNIQNNVDTVL